MSVDISIRSEHYVRMAKVLLELPHAEPAIEGSTFYAFRKRRARSVLWLTLISWASLLGMVTLATVGNPRLIEITAMRFATAVMGLFFCLLIHLLFRRPFLSTTRKRLIALAIVSPVFAEIFAWTNFFALAAVDPTVPFKSHNWTSAFSYVAFYTWFFLAWSGLYLALAYSFDLQEEQQRATEIRERAHAAQLRALHSQINPHFLFNSLNSLSALILDGKLLNAEEMLVKLASFLRMGLAAKPTEKIPLSAEVRFQQAYLDLEQVRYADLRTDLDIPDDLNSALVPALILQPVVENAVKYGVANSPPPAWVRIGAWAEPGRLFLQVTDSGKGKDSKTKGSGIGLTNVIERLRLIYGEDNVWLRAGPLPDGAFRTELNLPLEFA